jgi:chorismate mutase
MTNLTTQVVALEADRIELFGIDQEIQSLLRKRRRVSRSISQQKSQQKSQLGITAVDLQRELQLRQAYVDGLHSHQGRELADLIRSYCEPERRA